MDIKIIFTKVKFNITLEKIDFTILKFNLFHTNESYGSENEDRYSVQITRNKNFINIWLLFCMILFNSWFWHRNNNNRSKYLIINNRKQNNRSSCFRKLLKRVFRYFIFTYVNYTKQLAYKRFMEYIVPFYVQKMLTRVN